MRKTSLSSVFLSLSLVGTVSAGTMGSVCNSFLCAANNPGGFYLGISGVYGQPSETGLGLVTDSWLYGTTAISKPFDPDYKWYGIAKLGYDIPGTANNVEINYLFLNNGTHAVNDFSDGSIGFGSILFPDATVPPTPGFVSDALLTYKVSQVDGKVGRKYSDVSGAYQIRTSVGVRWAELKHSLVFAAPGNMISRFQGTGPLFSLDGRYGFGSNFGLVGALDYGLLIGQANSHSFVNLGTNYGFEWPKRNRVVNSVTGKLGIDYTYNYSNLAQFTLEGGYQVNEYFNAMDTIRGTLGFDSIQRINGLETNDFSVQGPYVSLTVHA
ncbi:Lpg1974 family pore-forming outer membrane protein [Legionella sp. km772]|uniref:Lpg1974 family pore-forming outer membrane protein n=1 Tax=Legionella sp. km772 TaxID=2498111 RepID=UPI000F8E0387|nr:Lpg1974 family pore-forming outer membrane protein [Legionella sp. km772]RUR05647.1 hypothetical protein ELY15_14065 [Legionella sp. km772]